MYEVGALAPIKNTLTGGDIYFFEKESQDTVNTYFAQLKEKVQEGQTITVPDGDSTMEVGCQRATGPDGITSYTLSFKEPGGETPHFMFRDVNGSGKVDADDIAGMVDKSGTPTSSPVNVYNNLLHLIPRTS